MTVVKEVLDAVGEVASGIEHIRTVAEAVRDGREYLRVQYPDVQADLAAMCVEMRNTAIAIAAASAVLTHFRFTVTGSDLDRQPARFNDYLVANKELAARVTQSLFALRGHCHKIKEHERQIMARAGSWNVTRLLALFGIDSAVRDLEVAKALNDVYDEEMQGYRLANLLSGALQRSLDEVSGALGPPGVADPARVPVAAALLGEYAEAFSRLESSSNFVVLELQESIDVLEGRT